MVSYALPQMRGGKDHLTTTSYRKGSQIESRESGSACALLVAVVVKFSANLFIHLYEAKAMIHLRVSTLKRTARYPVPSVDVFERW
mmetsp:Transcript_7747/g.10624  ORF Transcript_7747/g.10624 Transcript_7747/m.10624 type:complete len:86 (+) Transcript_7747:93-350(+)